jgi:uncharacterized protein (TIGR02246 family)
MIQIRMTPVLRLLATLLVSGAVASAAVAQQPALAAAKADIEPMFAAMLTAAHARDAERHMAAYAQDPALVFIYNEAKFSGYDAVLAMTRQAFAPGSDLAFQLQGEPQYQLLTPDWVMQTFFLTSTFTSPKGQAMKGRLSVSNLWHKRAEGWRIVYTHESNVVR